MKGKFERAMVLLADFLGHVSTLHGVIYLGRGVRSRKLFWAVFLLANVAFTLYLVIVIDKRFNKKQIYTQIDSTPKVSEVPFPSVMICNENLVSSSRLGNIERILYENRVGSAKINKFVSLLPLLALNIIDISAAKAVENDLNGIMDILTKHHYDVDDIMFEVHQKCENLLVYCSFNREVLDCDKVFSLVKTLMGYCCAFNYGGVGGGRSDIVKNSETLNSDNTEDSVGKTGFISTRESGRLSGLSVVYNVQPEDYPLVSPARFFGATIIINDPNDYPETTINTRYVTVGQHMAMKVSPLLFVSDRQLKRLSPAERNCWFDDELKVGFTSRYSFESCCTECKMQLFMRRCGCLPFFYPSDGKYKRICSFGDLQCLKNATIRDDPVQNEDTSIRCDCMPECSDKGYRLKNDVSPISASVLPDYLVGNYTLSNLSSIRVFYAKPTCTLYKKMLLMDWNDLIATYGGVFSLSVGASIVSLLELAYIIAVQMITKSAKFTLIKIS